MARHKKKREVLAERQKLALRAGAVAAPLAASLLAGVTSASADTGPVHHGVSPDHGGSDTGSTPSFTFDHTDKFSPYEEGLLRRGIANWEQSIREHQGEQWSFNDYHNAPDAPSAKEHPRSITFDRLPHDEFVKTYPGKYDPGTIAYSVGNRIVFDEDKWGQYSERDRVGVVAHEIGHSLGLGHSINGNDPYNPGNSDEIMRPLLVPDGPDSPNAAETAAVRKGYLNGLRGWDRNPYRPEDNPYPSGGNPYAEDKNPYPLGTGNPYKGVGGLRFEPSKDDPGLIVDRTTQYYKYVPIGEWRGPDGETYEEWKAKADRYETQSKEWTAKNKAKYDEYQAKSDEWVRKGAAWRASYSTGDGSPQPQQAHDHEGADPFFGPDLRPVSGVASAGVTDPVYGRAKDGSWHEVKAGSSIKDFDRFHGYSRGKNGVWGAMEDPDGYLRGPAKPSDGLQSAPGGGSGSHSDTHVYGHGKDGSWRVVSPGSSLDGFDRFDGYSQGKDGSWQSMKDPRGYLQGQVKPGDGLQSVPGGGSGSHTGAGGSTLPAADGARLSEVPGKQGQQQVKPGGQLPAGGASASAGTQSPQAGGDLAKPADAQSAPAGLHGQTGLPGSGAGGTAVGAPASVSGQSTGDSGKAMAWDQVKTAGNDAAAAPAGSGSVLGVPQVTGGRPTSVPDQAAKADISALQTPAGAQSSQVGGGLSKPITDVSAGSGAADGWSGSAAVKAGGSGVADASLAAKSAEGSGLAGAANPLGASAAGLGQQAPSAAPVAPAGSVLGTPSAAGGSGLAGSVSSLAAPAPAPAPAVDGAKSSVPVGGGGDRVLENLGGFKQSSGPVAPSVEAPSVAAEAPPVVSASMPVGGSQQALSGAVHSWLGEPVQQQAPLGAPVAGLDGGGGGASGAAWSGVEQQSAPAETAAPAPAAPAEAAPVPQQAVPVAESSPQQPAPVAATPLSAEAAPAVDQPVQQQ
ncbi:hypothetical protein ABIE67_009782 [Streptomyces sp. V4I8]